MHTTYVSFHPTKYAIRSSVLVEWDDYDLFDLCIYLQTMIQTHTCLYTVHHINTLSHTYVRVYVLTKYRKINPISIPIPIPMWNVEMCSNFWLFRNYEIIICVWYLMLLHIFCYKRASERERVRTTCFCTNFTNFKSNILNVVTWNTHTSTHAVVYICWMLNVHSHILT